MSWGSLSLCLCQQHLSHLTGMGRRRSLRKNTWINTNATDSVQLDRKILLTCFFSCFWPKIIGGKYLSKNNVLLIAPHPQTTCAFKIMIELCLPRTLAMWMLSTHLPLLALCRTEFWDWNSLLPLFKANLSARHLLPLGKVPGLNTKWISRKWQRERETQIMSLIPCTIQTVRDNPNELRIKL